MTEPNSINEGYEEYYLRTNPPSGANYQRKAKGYKRRFARLLDEAHFSSVLDIGCATGMLTNYLCRRCKDVVGVDCNAALIEVAKRNVPAEFVVDDALHYTATCERTFDVVFVLDLLEHLQRDHTVELLTNIRKILNDGGFAVVRVPNANCIHSMGMFYCDWTHYTPFTERTILHVANVAGFSRVEFCNQFRMHNFKGKIKACINAVLIPLLVWLRGGHKVKVFYRNLVVQMYK